MKVTITKYLNVRVGKPSVNAPCYQYLAPGSVLEVDGKLYDGDVFDGVTTWYKDEAGNYYWSGGVINSLVPNIATTKFDINKFWWIKDFNIEKLWEINPTGSNVKVAVLDTGLSLPHPDLIINTMLLHDITNSQYGIKDWSGHGTHISGIIKASHNEFGVQGISPNVDLFFAKVTNDVTGDSPDDLSKGIDWAIQQKVDIISISKGFQTDNITLKNSITSAIKNKILVVCASGNKINNAQVDIDFPARYSDTLSVGGIQENRTQLIDTVNLIQTNIFAPGYEILSTFKDSSYEKMTGSSQATPFVAAVAALLLQIIRENNPSYDAINLKDLIISTSDSESFGKIVNPLNSLYNIP